MNASSAMIEKAKEYLLAPVEEMERQHLPDRLQKRLLRLREFYAVWLADPRLRDAEVVAMIKEKYSIATTQAYEDLRIIKTCLGELNRHSREYDRYLFRKRCEEGWEMARKAGDLKAFASITSAYAKGCMLDKEDGARPDYSVIVPQQFTISSNPAAAGFTVVPGILDKAQKLYNRYAAEAEVVDEADELPEPLNPNQR